MILRRTRRDLWGTPDAITGTIHGFVFRLFGMGLHVEWWRE